MSAEYIRRMYRVPCYLGHRVTVKTWDGWTSGTVVSADHHVIVKPDKWPKARLRFHPEDTDHLRYEVES